MAKAGTHNPQLTPAMQQHRAIKQQYPQCVLFFQMGDFFEMFYEDAKLAHKVLGVTLTQRSAGVPMAGVPCHSVDGYLHRMVQAGHLVVVCQQTQDAAQAKGVVRRQVTRIVTPGTLTDESLLEESKENPLAAVVFHDKAMASIAWAELSTGSFWLATITQQELGDELSRAAPRELLFADQGDGQTPQILRGIAQSLGCITTIRPAWQFRQAQGFEALCKQFQVATLGGFGLATDDLALGAASAIVHYLLETQTPSGPTGADIAGHRIPHLQPPRRLVRDDHLIIDQTSLRSLEVEQTLRSGQTDGSVLSALQHCVTAMGKRTLRQWLCYPLRQKEPIQKRQRVVTALLEDPVLMERLRQTLDRVQDMQRIVGRIAVNRATPRDLLGLGTSAAQAQALVGLLADRPAVKHYHDPLVAIVEPLTTLATTITDACVDSPPAHLREGGLIRDGYDEVLDESRQLQHDSHCWLAEYQKQLSEQTGIANVKVGFNKVFGYYIELTAANKDKAPDSWARKQTLKNAERFVTPQLKEYEGKALNAQQSAIAREQQLFTQLCDAARDNLTVLQTLAQLAAELDVLACFAYHASRRQYVKPIIVEQPVLDIRGGRHPVLDELLGDRFVPNDLQLGLGEHTTAPDTPYTPDTLDPPEHGEAAPPPHSNNASLALITGPNMAGKSTYIRQAALITLLAHTGSFVPAESATVGLCDRIFTRIGASDELHSGQSTFMVEMTETAKICHHASVSSLVILDEIGRGTSTLDGLSLAWAIAEHLAARCCRTLFATHYHELTDLTQQFDNVTNLNVTVREWQDQIVFLHRIIPGSTDRSYGIHVAKIAGVPEKVLTRANELLGQLAVSHATPQTLPAPDQSYPTHDGQLSLFKPQFQLHPAIQELQKINIQSVTPLEAFDQLRRLVQLLDDSKQ